MPLLLDSSVDKTAVATSVPVASSRHAYVGARAILFWAHHRRMQANKALEKTSEQPAQERNRNDVAVAYVECPIPTVL